MARKKDVNFNRNPTGKGGFVDHPEQINRHGAPRKYMSWSEVCKAGMADTIEIEVTNPETGKKEKRKMPRMAVLFERTFRDAMAGSASARRHIINYTDGLPPQSITMRGVMATADVTELTPEEEAHLAEQFDAILGTENGRHQEPDSEDD
jgi:hypothetical protein